MQTLSWGGTRGLVSWITLFAACRSCPRGHFSARGDTLVAEGVSGGGECPVSLGLAGQVHGQQLGGPGGTVMGNLHGLASVCDVKSPQLFLTPAHCRK